MLVEHKPLQDKTIVAELFATVPHLCANDVDIGLWDIKQHIDIFKQWLTTGTTTTLSGLDNFKFSALCVGTSDVINNFIHRNTARRLRFSCAEFVLSKITCNNINARWKFIEDGELEPGDAVILSLPFSGNGGRHPDHDLILNTSTKLGIPVCLDIAYLGIAHNLHIDLTASCITDVTASLSKPFSVMLRHGIRFTREYIDDSVQYASDRGMLPRLNIVLASKLMQKFPKDYIVNKYLSKYRIECERLGLDTTNTITLALGNDQAFSRGGYNRVCITDEILT
jgi:hypothetical protein